MQKRSFFDWLCFLLIHVVIIGGISVAGFYVYGFRLGSWVAASAIVAGVSSMFLFAKDIEGEVGMKCVLGICVALNAGYLVDNGAKATGVELYNRAQVEKYEKGMAEAGKSASRRIARELALGAKAATELDRVFSDGVSLWVAVLGGLELGVALIIFAVASRRQTPAPEPVQQRAGRTRDIGIEPELGQITARADEFPEALPTGRLIEGKGNRR